MGRKLNLARKMSAENSNFVLMYLISLFKIKIKIQSRDGGRSDSISSSTEGKSSQ